MGRKNKLKKFAEIRTFDNVYENYNYEDDFLIGPQEDEYRLAGKWRQQHFKNDKPIVLELACGGGEYTLSLAERYKKKNHIGVDIKGARIWKGARKALAAGLDNVVFLRCKIEKINTFFTANEVDEIWITFPDPFLKDSKENRRLTAPSFLDRYKSILKPDGCVHLKTDSQPLYEFTLETLSQRPDIEITEDHNDIYSQALPHHDLDIKTYYEQKHLKAGLTIKYIQFRYR